MRYKVPFVLASTVHGPVILSAIDWAPLSQTHVECGVGLGLLIEGQYDPDLIGMALGALEARRQSHGAGVLAIDGGANIGIYSMEWGRSMDGWGSVLAFEPQERMFYALAGNLAINNIFNVRAFNKALGKVDGVIDMPLMDYNTPSQYGGVSLKDGVGAGKYRPKIPVELLAIDSLGCQRLDFLKLDIEGMEVEALEGAKNTIERFQPFILLEWHICGKEPVETFMQSIGYVTAPMGMNMFAGPPGGYMDGLKRISDQLDEYHVGSSRTVVREGVNGGTGPGQQDSVGAAG